jgi:hypothetical protein
MRRDRSRNFLPALADVGLARVCSDPGTAVVMRTLGPRYMCYLERQIQANRASPDKVMSFVKSGKWSKNFATAALNDAIACKLYSYSDLV